MPPVIQLIEDGMMWASSKDDRKIAQHLWFMFVHINSYSTSFLVPYLSVIHFHNRQCSPQYWFHFIIAFLLSFWTICSQNIFIYSIVSPRKGLLKSKSYHRYSVRCRIITQQSKEKIYNVIVEYHSNTLAHYAAIDA